MVKIIVTRTGQEAEVGTTTAGDMVRGGYAKYAEAPKPKQWADGRDAEQPASEPIDAGYEGMLKSDLVSMAEARGLDSSGTKADLVARLELSDQGTEGA